MTNVLYSIERDVVDPVFFAVVPDSFMTRSSSGRPMLSVHLEDDLDGSDEQDAPIVSPHDRWSF
ncbi:MAG: hypothetical protein IPK78_13810 [Rhodospirillales bacterium]|nr:hypothetical protein [Rhodospirillales bacterium]